MTTLLISIREPSTGPRTPEALISAISPHLNVIRANVKLVSIRHYRQAKGGSLAGPQVNAEFEWDDVSDAELPSLLRKTETYLHRLRKDAGTLAKFSLCVLDEEVDDG